MVVLRRQGVKNAAVLGLAPKQRLRPLSMLWIDPLLAFLFAGGMVGTLVERDPLRILTVVLGGVVGLAIGVARGRAVYIACIPEFKSVVMKRNAIEFILLGVLLALRIAEDAIAKTHSTVLTFVLCGLMSIAIGESLARAATLTQRYRSDRSLLPSEAPRSP